MRAMFACVAMWLVALMLPGQQTWVVDRFNRPGTDFTDLPQAVAAASSGDILRLRATTTTVMDAYTAPTIQGKGLTIVGETLPVRSLVLGGWNISGVPASNVLTITGIEIIGALIPTSRPSFVACTSCLGAVVLDDVVVSFWGGAPAYGGLTDCRMVTLSRCTIEWVGTWLVQRSTLMINDSTIRGVPYFGAFGAPLKALDSIISIARSSVYGSSDPDPWFPNNSSSSPAIVTCGSQFTIGGGCLLASGTTRSGGHLYPIFWPDCSNQTSGRRSTVNMHLATTIGLGGYCCNGGIQGITYVDGLQTGLAYSLTPTTLQVDQYTTPLALTVLAIGAVNTTSWTYLVGPVFVDPVGMTDYMDPAPLTAFVLRRSFTIPPGLPPGTHVCMQAFELLPNGQLLTSNATIAGIW